MGPSSPTLAARLRAQVQGLPSTYWYLWAGMLINYMGFFVVPFLTLYLTQERGMPLAQAGGIVSLHGIGSLAAGPVGGALADRLGRRVTMVGGLVLAASLVLALGFARQPLAIGLLVLALGFCNDSHRTASSALVADLVAAPADRLRAYAHLYWAGNLGFAVATLIAGQVARYSYLALFVADAATTFAFAAVAWLRIPEAPRTEDEDGHGAVGWRPLTIAFRDTTFMSFVAVTFPLGFVFFQFMVTLPADMTAHGASPADYGAVIAVNGILIALLQPLALEWIPRFRRSRVLATSSLLVGLGFGLNAVVHQPVLYGLAVALWTLGEICHAPTSSSLVADLAPAHARGRYQGAYNMAWALATTTAPALGALGLSVLGPWHWGLCFVIAGAVALAHLSIAGARGRRLAVLRNEAAAAAAVD